MATCAVGMLIWTALAPAPAHTQTLRRPGHPHDSTTVTEPTADPKDPDDIQPVGAWLRMRLQHVPPSTQLDVTLRFDPAVICSDPVLAPGWTDCASTPDHKPAVATAQLPADTIQRTARQPGVIRLELADRPGALQPLSITAETTGSAALRRRPDLRWTGDGITIAMIDSGVDILHPALFRADAGAYSWIDADGDGTLTGGSGDGVDLDGDGGLDRNERLRVVQSADIIDFPDGTIRRQNDTFEPDRDWLYIDRNENGRRDAGLRAGFAESTPAYGEPLFVADDVDDDGRIRPAEKLFRLGSSKIRRLQLGETTYRRGDNLIAAASKLEQVAIHGTGTAGIMVAGQPRFHQRAGMAPGADLLVYSPDFSLDGRTTRHIDALRDARDSADVFLHQWVNPFTQPIAGQTNLDVALNRVSDAGMPQIVPVGNLHGARKHTSRVDPPSDPSLPFQMPDAIDVGSERQVAVDRVIGGFQYDGELSGAQLKAPTGTVLSIPLDGQSVEQTIMEVAVRARGSTDSPGSRSNYFAFDIDTDGSAGLPTGEWSFQLSFARPPDRLWGRVSDTYSQWDAGVQWVTPTQSSTISHPAAARSAVGVGAHMGRRFDSPNTPTSPPTTRRLRTFSGRGPSFDGRRTVDIVAPDNPLTPLAAISPPDESDWGTGSWVEFGGTSGAAPHVAGAVAQLLEPDDPPALPASLLQAAVGPNRLEPRPQTLPSVGWGFGGLDALRAVDRRSPPIVNRPPILQARISRQHRTVLRLSFDGTRDPDGDPLTLQVDTDYDGDYERQPRDLQAMSLATTTPDEWIKIQLRDQWGAGDSLLLNASPTDQPDAGTVESDGLDDTSGGCACRHAPQRPLPATLLWIGVVSAWLVVRSRRFENPPLIGIIRE